MLRTLLHTALLLSWLLPAAGSTQQVGAAARSGVGINLSGVRPYRPELPFVDLIHLSRRWRVSGGDKTLDLGPDGWPRRLLPGQTASLPFFAGLGLRVPPGVYVCLHDGKGRLEWKGAHVVGGGPGRIELRFDPAKQHHALILHETDPSDPIRNVRLLMPGTEATHRSDPFRPGFPERWKGFSVLRFMDWGETNNSRVRAWSDRTLPDQFQASEKGVALEHMIALANRLDAEPWFCIPHQADDDYVRRFAQLVKERLDPELRVWVEYSNEVWNGMFRQAKYARARGTELGLSPKGRIAGFRFTARRSVEIFRIFEEVFGGDERLVRVLAGQFSSDSVAREILSFENAHQHADVYAVAPYFGGRAVRKEGARVATLSVDALIAELETGLPANQAQMKVNVAVAAEFGLPLVAYEGGQHLRGDPKIPGLTELLNAANRHIGMGRLYARYLANWREAGGRTFVHFASMGKYSENGSWGALEWYDQDAGSAPKYRALLDFAANPRWWEGAP